MTAVILAWRRFANDAVVQFGAFARRRPALLPSHRQWPGTPASLAGSTAAVAVARGEA